MCLGLLLTSLFSRSGWRGDAAATSARFPVFLPQAPVAGGGGDRAWPQAGGPQVGTLKGVRNIVLKLSAHFLQTPEDKARKGKGWSWGPSLGPDSYLFTTPTLRELQGKPRSFPGLATRRRSGEGTHSHPFRLVTGKFQILSQVPDGQLSAGTVTLGPQLAFLLACERAACCQARARASSCPHPRGAHRDSVLATGHDGCQTGGRAQGEIPESVPISTRAGVRPSAVKL